MQLKEFHPSKQEDSKPQGHKFDEPDSEDISINEESAQQRTANAQEVQAIASQEPGISRDTGPAEASIPSEEPRDNDAGPRLELTERPRSESQKQLSQPEPQECKMQNALA